MPDRSISARRYAEALFDIADQQEKFVQWAGDLQTIVGFVTDASVALILRSERVPRHEKTRLLRAGLERQISAEAMNLVRLLNERGKLDQIEAIAMVFREKVDERRGIAHAVVTTAVTLSDDEHRAVAARLSTLTGKNVDVTAFVDESIIGGLVARIGDQLIDGSTRTRLLALRRSLEGAAR